MRYIKIMMGISLIILLFNSCGIQRISYSTKGGTISPELKTYSVDYFPNRAPLVMPSLSTTFEEKLKNYIRSNTHLKEVTDNNGDVRFEGQITRYSQEPVNIQRDEVAASNRLTITIQIKYTDTYDEENSFSQSFSAYEDYSIDADFNSIEESLIDTILDKIIEDIYNRAFVNW